MNPAQRILIVGGGTAGWMAACLMAHHWGTAAQVTVVESPDIGIIGVGEGSTPQLVAFFEKLGIAEAEWMPACNATYKAGIRFTGWSDEPGFESYFHPFAGELDVHTQGPFQQHTRVRRAGRDVAAHPDRFFVSQRVAAERRAPKPAGNFPFALGYGYHFDAVLVGRFLREHAVGKLGVVHRQATVESVEVADDRRIAAIVLADGERIAADLFVDASGFRGLLIQEAMGEPFLSFASNLFNDRAVAMPTPREEASLSCETEATALTAGWAWRIPLTNRYGNGYVYASRYLAPEAAEAELRAHIGAEDGAEARHLTMKVGRVANSLVGNCLAIGLAQGFIEPLEATALHIVQATVEGYIAARDAGTPEALTAFNAAIAARYEGIRDYIVCHYRVNRRTARGDYWRDAAAMTDLSDHLKAVMTAWFTADDLGAVIERRGIAGYYAPLSWHCLLGGYGVYPGAAKLRPPEPGLGIADMARIDDFVERCSRNFADHASAVAALAA